MKPMSRMLLLAAAGLAVSAAHISAQDRDAAHRPLEWPGLADLNADLGRYLAPVEDLGASLWQGAHSMNQAAMVGYAAHSDAMTSYWMASRSGSAEDLKAAFGLATLQNAYARQFGLSATDDYLGVTNLLNYIGAPQFEPRFAKGTALLVADFMQITAQHGQPPLAVRVSHPDDWHAHNSAAFLETYASALVATSPSADKELLNGTLVALPIQISGQPVLALVRPEPQAQPDQFGTIEHSAKTLLDRAAFTSEPTTDFIWTGPPYDHDTGLYIYDFIIHSVHGPQLPVPDYTNPFQEFVSQPSFPGRGLPESWYDGGTDQNDSDANAVEVPCNSSHPNAPPCYNPAVSLHRNGVVHCSGALVGASWVLSAAHCACGAGDLFASVGPVTPDRRGDVPNLTSTVGLTGGACFFGQSGNTCDNLDTLSDTDGYCASQSALDGVSALTPNGQAAHRAHYAQRDLVLLQLQEPLQLTLRNPPLGTPAEHDPYITTIGHPERLTYLDMMVVAGFGRNDEQANGGRKTVAPMPVESASCNEEATCIDGQEFVTFDPGGLVDSCFGDSGAGLYAVVPEGGYQLFGIVSRGVTVRCGAGGINTTVAHADVIQWIRANVADARIANPAPDGLQRIVLHSNQEK